MNPLNPNNDANPPGHSGIQFGKDKRKEKKYYGKLLVGIVFLILIIEYYAYVFGIMIPIMTQKNFFVILTLLIIFHILLILVLMAFISTMNTNPGEIPLYWGFYIGDDDYKRKRYCLICNAFKPERSHHCSVCNVCVLNMDHHCPWVDNCIGFYNRKFFMQLLIYVTFLTIYVDISLFYFIMKLSIKLIKMEIKYSEIFHSGFVIICYIAVLIFSVIISMFLKFHLGLVKINSTTIESLDTEHAKDYEKYNLGLKKNWRQIFGPEPLFWFIPINEKRGNPEGDGLTWETNEIAASNNYNDLEKKNNNYGQVENNNIYNTNNYQTNYNSNAPQVISPKTNQ